jgi:hypothetical protein
MADVVDLRSRQPVSHEDEFNSQLVQDLARFAEGGLITEKEIRRRYQFDDAVWESLADNEALIAAIEDEKVRRVRSGALKRERAQALVTSAPGVLGEILLAKDANPRHRIDSCKVLNDLAANGPGDTAPAADRFQITINLGADHILHFDKSIDITPNDDGDDDPHGWNLIAVAAKNKSGDDGSGQGHL